MKKSLLLLLTLALLLCACAAEPEPQAAPSAGPVPTAAPEATAAPTPQPTVVPTPQPEAAQLSISLQGAQHLSLLQDGKFDTACALPAGGTITVTAEEEIGSLYLSWYDHPLPWTLETPSGAAAAGESGFLHEYVALPAPAREVTIRLPETARVRLSDICAFSPGRLPDWVQVWQPPCEEADLLVVPTHADDEFLFFGGLLPLYAAERGLRVQVVYMISHYHSLRERCDELLNALWLAGVRNYPVVHTAPDREIYSVGEAEYLYGKTNFLDFQVEQIRRFRPLIIVTHDENGEYRQGNHMFTALSMEKAVELAADASYQPRSAEKYGVWDTPKTYLHLYGPEEERTVLDYETPLDAFGGKTAFAVAEEAYALHRSQQQLAFRVYEAGHAYDCHSFGLFRSLVGPDDDRNDLMEHLHPADWRS